MVYKLRSHKNTIKMLIKAFLGLQANLNISILVQGKLLLIHQAMSMACHLTTLILLIGFGRHLV